MSKTQQGKKTITTSLPVALIEQVNMESERQNRTRSAIIEEALIDWLWWEEEKHRRILEGLADVDAGRTISDEAIGEWIDSLGTDHELPVPK